jgi:hypothetical protein
MVGLGATAAVIQCVERLGNSVEPQNSTLTLTKVQGATRQTEAAIEAFVRGDFDIAITLAGAAEGMLEREGPHMFSFLRDSRRVQRVDEKKTWIATLNVERDWLKHPHGTETLHLEQGDAAIMIARAASKLDKWTPRMDEFKVWLLAHVDDL